MKQIIILISFFFLFSANADAQRGSSRPGSGSTLPYKPLSDFGSDTIAFFNYNFTQRADQYKGKTIEEVLKDAQLPPKSFLPMYSIYVGKVDGIIINFDRFTPQERSANNHKNNIYIYISL